MFAESDAGGPPPVLVLVEDRVALNLNYLNVCSSCWILVSDYLSMRAFSFNLFFCSTLIGRF